MRYELNRHGSIKYRHDERDIKTDNRRMMIMPTATVTHSVHVDGPRRIVKRYVLVRVTYTNWTKEALIRHAAENDSTPYARLEEQCSIVLAPEEPFRFNSNEPDPVEVSELTALAEKKLGKIVISIDGYKVITEETPSKTR